MTYLQQLQSRFSTFFSTGSLLVTGGRVEQLAVDGCAFPYILVGRDLCRYTCFDLGHVPRSDRANALDNSILLKSHFAETGYWVSWHGGWAQVWFWDQSKLEKMVADSGNSTYSALGLNPLYLPVSMFLNDGLEDGLFEVELATGYELQNRASGVLHSSQWYPVKPDEGAKHRFCRAEGRAIDVEFVAVDSRSVSAAEIVSNQVVSFERLWPDLRGKAFKSAVAISVIVLSFQLTTIGQWWLFSASLQSDIADLESSSRELLDSRAEVRRAAIDLQRRADLLDVPSSIAVQKTILASMPANESLKLHTWERVDRSVSIVIEGDIPDTLGIVRALEGNGLRNVKVEPQPKKNFYNIELQVPADLRVPGETS